MIPGSFPKQSPLCSREISSLDKKGHRKEKWHFVIYVLKKTKHKKTTQQKKRKEKTHTSTFFTCFLPSFPSFHCTLITDAFDELCAGSGFKAQMKAIFSRAICQRKSQGEKKTKPALNKASSPLGSC